MAVGADLVAIAELGRWTAYNARNTSPNTSYVISVHHRYERHSRGDIRLTGALIVMRRSMRATRVMRAMSVMRATRVMRAMSVMRATRASRVMRATRASRVMRATRASRVMRATSAFRVMSVSVMLRTTQETRPSIRFSI